MRAAVITIAGVQAAAVGVRVGSSDGFKVDHEVLFRSSVRFLDSKEFAYNIASGTAGDLQSSAGMVGNDDTGKAFAGKYEPAARATVHAMGVAGQALAKVSAELLTIAWWHLKMDDTLAAAFNGGQIDTASAMAPPQTSDCDPSNAAETLPHITGTGQESDIPVIGKFWPQADPDKLRAAAHVWNTAADLMDQAQRNAAGHAQPVLASAEGATADAFKAYCASVFTGNPSGGDHAEEKAPLIDNVSASCRSLAKMCSAFADQVDSVRDTIIGIGVGVGIATVAGVALTVFTLGASDEAAGANDAGLVAEASAAATELAAAAGTSSEAAVVAEAEQIIAQAASRIPVEVSAPGEVPTIPAVTIGTSGAAAPTHPASTTPSRIETALNPESGAVGPIPPPEPSPFPLYSPHQQTAAQTWVQGLESRPPNYGTPADRAYQLRVAGEPERKMSAENGRTVWADGFRPADGAIIDAKNVRKQGCSPRSLQGVHDNSFETQLLQTGDERELSKYQGAIENPSNHAQYLELDTNDRETVGYWQFLCAENHVKSNVRYAP
ncbi:hypothetical protein BJ970_006684 [Saccharopolyspora phatthalungensis]|uniref:Tox-REase-2 domain-containing protein n=1 Tax=Saccharopolyspora phatthalungensis TaxID=664693 RepID=A0A840QJH9_9PSEU|nr:hypothetical protein [Saccharopolyspora phatthalungensis]